MQIRILTEVFTLSPEKVAQMRKDRVYCVLNKCRLSPRLFFYTNRNTPTSTSFSTAADKHIPVSIERFFLGFSKHVSDMQKYPSILRNILPPASVCLCSIHARRLCSLHSVDLRGPPLEVGGRRTPSTRGRRRERDKGERKRERSVKMVSSWR